MIKKALVFQHMDDEPPGLFGEFLTQQGQGSIRSCCTGARPFHRSHRMIFCW